MSEEVGAALRPRGRCYADGEMRRIAPSFLALGLLASSAVALAGPPTSREGPSRSDRREDLPFSRGTVLPILGLGGSFGSGISTLGFRAGAIGFPVGGIGLGLEFDNNWIFYSKPLRRDYPGIFEQTSTYVARVMPVLMFVPFRRGRVIPYLRGAVGPEFRNHGGPVVGHWEAALGAWAPLGRFAFFHFGVSVGSSFTAARCQRAYNYNGEPIFGSGFGSPCGIYVAPTIGIGFGIPTNGARERARERRRERSEPDPQPSVEPQPTQAVPPQPASNSGSGFPVPAPTPTPAASASAGSTPPPADVQRPTGGSGTEQPDASAGAEDTSSGTDGEPALPSQDAGERSEPALPSGDSSPPIQRPSSSPQ